MNISRTPVWIEQDNDTRIFAWIHLPDAVSYNHAFIVVGAIGPEYMHTHRSVRLLADCLAKTGSLAIRYDPVGMGNSSSDLEEQGLWDKWISSPAAIREHIKSQYHIDNYSILAFRSGSLILNSYFKNYQDDTIIFWYPYIRGSAFIRDMKMLDGKSKLLEKDNTTLEGGGYPVTEETQNTLTKVNLLTTQFGNYKNVLIIENGELTTKSNLAKQLNKKSPHTEKMFLHGLSAMARQAALSVVPVDNIDSICNWIKALPLKASDIQIKQLPVNTLKSSEYTEETIFINSSKPVFGVLTTPANLKNPTSLLILSNSGSGHHPGPNRFHVHTARQLAEQGIATFRMDLSNLGDSPLDFNPDNNHPYPDSASEDLCSTLEYFSNMALFNNIILAGLCSGAHNSFHASLKTESNKLRGLILLNVLTFYWKTGHSILAPAENELEINASQYQSNLTDFKKWIGIFSSPSKIPRLAIFAFNLIKNKIGTAVKKILSLFGYQKNTRLDKDLDSIISKNIKLHFLYSENEPTYKILMSQAGGATTRQMKHGNITIHKIKSTDHTFSSRQSKEELINSIIRSVKEIINQGL